MKNRNELINGWIKEINEILRDTEKLSDQRQKEMRMKWLERLKVDLNRLRDGFI